MRNGNQTHPEFLLAAMARLRAMASDPPFVYRDTPPELIERERLRLSLFEGYSEEEVTKVERELQVELPESFRSFLLGMGRSSGELFQGSDVVRVEEWTVYRAQAEELMRERDTDLTLPIEAVVFLFHQGYSFLYVLGTGEEDSPVFQYVEGASSPVQISSSFIELVEAEMAQIEDVHASWHDRGGYYRTLYSDGTASDTYPALASGDKPLRNRTKPWWRFWGEE